MTKPNLVYIFCDQFRRQAIGYMGEDPVVTPHLDQFAREGVVFNQAVSNYPVCSPYRGILLTGLYPHKNHIFTNCNSKSAPKVVIYVRISFAYPIFYLRMAMN